MEYYRVIKPIKGNRYKVGDIISVRKDGKVLDIVGVPKTLDLTNTEYFIPVEEKEATAVG